MKWIPWQPPLKQWQWLFEESQEKSLVKEGRELKRKRGTFNIYLCLSVQGTLCVVR